MVGVLSTPALAFVFKLIVAKSAKLTLNRQGAAGRAMEYATERLTHVRTVKVFAAEDREAASYGTLTQEGYNLATKCAMFQGLVEGYSRLAINTTTLSLLAIGGALVLAGKVSLGLLLSFNVFNVFLGVGLSTLAASLGDMGKTVGAMERIAQVVQGNRDPAADSLFEYDETIISTAANPSTKTKNKAATAALSNTTNFSSSSSSSTTSTFGGSSVELRDVFFKYQGRTDWALQGLTLSVPPGSTLALVGPSGGGKSTTAALLLGLYTPQKGQVLLDGVVLDPHTIPNARRSIGTVLQQPALMSGTVAEQIALGCPDDATEENITAAADAAHASGFINALPEKFNTELGEKGAQLSGGQQQRLSIARALARRPKLLLLDEPTAALDVDAERAVDEALQEIKGVTKVIIAHRLSTIRSAESIAVVVGGRVVEQGSHMELMGVEGGHYKRMVMNSELGGGLDPELVHGSNGSGGTNGKEKAHAAVAAAAAVTSVDL
jgi:ATP-binding cassette, subfamily B, bacterial